MICSQCAHAADQRLPRGHHCDTTRGPGAACDCAHRVDRYRPAPLTVINATPPLRFTACDEGRHRAHPGETCGDYEEDATRARAAWDRLMAPVTAGLERYAADADAHADAVEAAIARVEAEHRPDDIIRIPHATTEQCRAECHDANGPPGRCDLSAGHAEHHRDQTIPGVLRWTEDVAIYSHATTED